jgi:hypothetical protein
MVLAVLELQTKVLLVVHRQATLVIHQLVEAVVVLVQLEVMVRLVVLVLVARV